MKKLLIALLVFVSLSALAQDYLSRWVTSYCYVYIGMQTEGAVYGYIKKNANVIVEPIDAKWAKLIFGPVRHTKTDVMLKDNEIGKDAFILMDQLTDKSPGL